MHDVSGVTGAAPVFRDLVHFLHRSEPSVRPAAPARLVAQTVGFDPPVEAPRREWFLAGTAMATVRAAGLDADAAAAATPRIRYPAPDTIIALDPDIPVTHQRVALVAAPVTAGLRWRIDDIEVAEGARVLWSPTSGRHRVVLEGADGAVLSTVDFEVRGVRAGEPFRAEAR
jgi:penicillin-binding protein 1C